jgi:hypothetical protein
MVWRPRVVSFCYKVDILSVYIYIYRTNRKWLGNHRENWKVLQGRFQGKLARLKSALLKNVLFN